MREGPVGMRRSQGSAPREAPLSPPLAARLAEASLTDEDMLRATEVTPDERLLPFADVIKIGGQSMIDRGRKALFPLLEELVSTLGDHKLIIASGAGTRARPLVC